MKIDGCRDENTGLTDFPALSLFSQILIYLSKIAQITLQILFKGRFVDFLDRV